jgi:RNA polymerase sigma factor (sigma-70 family)
MTAQEADFEKLYSGVAPAVYTWACLHVHEPLRALIDPEDVLQEVACRAYEGFAQYDGERASFRQWLFGIARKVLYQAMDRLGSGSVRPQALDTERMSALPDTATSITRRVSRDEQIATFLGAVAQLPDEDRRLLMYRGLEGLTHERVGELMHLSPDAVAQRWSRLRGRLKERGPVVDFVAA